MWRWIRIGVLLFILASVAQSAWVARTRTAEWKTSLRVVIYPISADASATSTQYVSDAAQDRLSIRSRRFSGPRGRSTALRWAIRSTFFSRPRYRRGRRPRRSAAARFASSCGASSCVSGHGGTTPTRAQARRAPFRRDHDPALTQRLPHSTGLQKGLMGVVNAFAERGMEGSNNVVITHEVAAYPRPQPTSTTPTGTCRSFPTDSPIPMPGRFIRSSAPKSWPAAFRFPKRGRRSRKA